MSDLLKRLHEQRLRAVAAAREIAERAAKGEERADDETAYGKANAEIDRLGGLETDERKRVADEIEFGKAFDDSSRKAGIDEGKRKDDRKTPSWDEDARAAVKSGARTSGVALEQVPTEARMRELRALTDPLAVGTSTRGPELVPETLVDRLFSKLFDDSAVLSAGPTILRTSSGETLKFPRLTSLGALSQSNSRVAELGTLQKGTPTFDQVEIEAYKYGQIAQSSREVIEDSIIDVRGLMGTALGRNMANYLGYDFTLGNGTSQPKGVVSVVPSGNKVTGATGKTGKPSDLDDILDVIAKLKPPYRRNAKWLMNDATTFVLRKFKMVDATGENTYAWQPGLVPGSADTLMGYPIVVDPNIATCALNAISIVFADFSMYYVRFVNDVRVEWSTEYAWDTDLISVKAVVRADGDTIDDTAFAAFVGGSS